ncbi:MAG: flagellar FlbD family protein [Clostridiales bacterium]|nr:flagellar FlbD family protein [Clostridiales bacterium]MDR2750052.1 flagellar FlbD family protein [Clostridiales bacterium]
MINITKLNGKLVTVNCDLILSMEESPDTTITMTTGDKLIARESITELVQRVIAFKSACLKKRDIGA